MNVLKLRLSPTHLPDWQSKLVLFVYNSLSDMLYLLVAHLFQYRKGIIRANLKASFKGISTGEEKLLTEKYYRHICDLLTEPFIINSVSFSCLNRMVRFENLQLLHRYYRQNRNIVLMASHYGNWEYLFTLPMFTDYEVIAAYSPLANRFWDKKIKKLRTRFGLTVIPKADLYKTVLRRKSDRPAIYILICDQCPPSPAKHFVEFLNQHTAVHVGPEKIARKTASAVMQLEVRKEIRNCYVFGFRLICDDGSKEAENRIIHNYYAELENKIKRQPELWLWSHRRWKHTRKVTAALSAGQ